MTSYELTSFVTTHDGTQVQVPERESLIASQKFSSLVDDILLNHAGTVRHFDLMGEDSILLELPLDEQNKWTIDVRSRVSKDENNKLFAPSEIIMKEIGIQKISEGYGRDYLAYSQGSDGIVRRWDGGDVIQKRRAEQAQGLKPMFEHVNADMSSVQMLEIVTNNLADLITNAIPNRRLEGQMGLNDQPVSLSEIEGLADMVMSPNVQVPSMY